MHAKLDSFIEVKEKNPFFGAVTFGIKTLIINSHCSYPKYKYEEKILTFISVFSSKSQRDRSIQ
jgi:hypothetical protein